MGTLLVLSGFALWPAQPGAPLLVREAGDAAYPCSCLFRRSPLVLITT
jgi:hypothetical protein